MSRIPHPFLGLILVLAAVSCDEAAGEPGTTAPAAPSLPPAASGGSGGAGGAGADAGPRRGEGSEAADIYATGEGLAAQGNVEEATLAYRRAIKIDPTFADAHFALGKILVHTSYVVVGSGARDQDILDEAIQALERAAELRPENAEYAYWAGRALTLQDRDEEAVEWLAKAIELEPTHGLAHKRMGLARSRMEGGTEDAKASFLLAMDYLPDDGGVPFQYGNLLEADDVEGAIEAYRKAIEVDPTFPKPYSKLGPLLARQGDTEGAEKAKEDFERWKALDDQLRNRLKRANQDPNDVQALLRVGEVYFAIEKWPEAADWFRRVLVLDATIPLAHLYRGIVMRHLGEYETATNHLFEAAYLSPDSIEPQLELIRLFVVMEDEERLEERLNLLTSEIDPAEGDVRVRIADLLLDVERSAEAVKWYEGVLAQHPEHVEALAGLARARDGEGR